MGDEYLEAIHHLDEGDRFVCLPVLHGLSVFNKDDKILVLALVVDLRLSTVPTRHDGNTVGDFLGWFDLRQRKMLTVLCLCLWKT